MGARGVVGLRVSWGRGVVGLRASWGQKQKRWIQGKVISCVSLKHKHTHTTQNAVIINLLARQ